MWAIRTSSERLFNCEKVTVCSISPAATDFESMSVLPLGRADILNEALDFAEEKKTEPTHLNSEYLDWIWLSPSEFNTKLGFLIYMHMPAARSRSFRNRGHHRVRALFISK